MSFKGVIKERGATEFIPNMRAFATQEEAENSTFAIFFDWLGADEYKIVESDEPVNYRWDKELGNVRLADTP